MCEPQELVLWCLREVWGWGGAGGAFPGVCTCSSLLVSVLFSVLFISIYLFSTRAFSPSNTKLRIPFTLSSVSSHFAVSF